MLRFERNVICAAVFAVFLISCKTVKEPESVFVFPDYTEEDVAAAEIKRIDDMMPEYPVQALWRAKLLKNEEIIARSSDNLKSLFKKALDESDYYTAMNYYRSLAAVETPGLESFGVTEKQLYDRYIKDVPGFTVDEKLLPKTMADCVAATVTVVVDLGIKIKYGAGYADKVMGSGFFIDKRGYIITNNHVISDLVDPKREGYARLYIKLANDPDTLIPAKLIGHDPMLDLALLKAEVDPPFILSLGSSSDLSVGDGISVIGTPLGVLNGTITSGIVSSVNRRLLTAGSVLQIDAAVTFGNSGGPCIDRQMRVQAVVFSGAAQASGLNFAVPVEYLRQDLPYLYHGGKRVHAWTGAFGQTMKEGQNSTGLNVMYVMPGGSISRAGIQRDAVIKFVNGKRIYGIEDMQDILRSCIPETIIRCSYQLGNETQEVLLYLAERPEQPGYEIYNSDLITGSFVPIFGMKLISSSTASRRKYSITDVIKGSIADESGFSENDPIYVADVDFSENNEAIRVQVNTRRKKKGYLDLSMFLTSPLDSPYYF